MKLIVHRGTHEIGGSCVEIESNGSRIVLDIGIPLINAEGERFNLRDYSHLQDQQFIQEGVLPDIRGLYSWDKSNALIDGLLISHAHLDHYGLYSFLDKDIHYFTGKGTKRVIELSEVFLGYPGNISKHTGFESGKPFEIGSFKITPYLMDHSAFDAYAFLIEAEGKKILYSGDFREHGRKTNAFRWFLHKVPEGVDALLLEGSLLGRENSGLKTEQDIEAEIFKILKEKDNIVFGVSSTQNIDRLVSFFKAALKADRLFAIDVYTANILDGLKDLAKIPYPSDKFPNIRVFFPRFACKRLVRNGQKERMFRFRPFRITKKEISESRKRVLMMVRPSMTFDMSHIAGIEGATVIYSMWEGYLKDASTRGIREIAL